MSPGVRHLDVDVGIEVGEVRRPGRTAALDTEGADAVDILDTVLGIGPVGLSVGQQIVHNRGEVAHLFQLRILEHHPLAADEVGHLVGVAAREGRPDRGVRAQPCTVCGVAHLGDTT